ncbi:hypothetical protein [Arsenicicoccus sp. oral taxon 190]|uniref:hypothetical protein n=1 Tax=Arsenicicoccus sp. oral taxon 190 TaxID=1658671 RepID=UPI00067A0598|nr:hypothetical protein [Arsenicicoccus sp. oral taxon 190]AKT51079.1 hypothetical protein ADJ73_06660 [Arsenicicoccus sp. oral taxon 190]
MAQPAARPRSWTSRLGEGLVMALSFLLFRLLMGWIGLFRPESFWSTLVSALLFGAAWVGLTLAFDAYRARRARP